jgi:hypothetical protein
MFTDLPPCWAMLTMASAATAAGLVIVEQADLATMAIKHVTLVLVLSERGREIGQSRLSGRGRFLGALLSGLIGEFRRTGDTSAG